MDLLTIFHRWKYLDSFCCFWYIIFISVLFLFFRTKRFVALKVVKSAQHYTETALDEIKLLKCVSLHIFTSQVSYSLTLILTLADSVCISLASKGNKSYLPLTHGNKWKLFCWKNNAVCNIPRILNRIMNVYSSKNSF